MILSRYNFFVLITLLFIGGLVAIGPETLAQTYVPASSPFTGPVAPPLNSSSTAQQKLGTLLVGSPTNKQKICLNATNSSDATNCINSWNQLSGQFGGPF